MEVASSVSPQEAFNLISTARAAYATPTSRLIGLAADAVRQHISASDDERGLVTQALTAAARRMIEPLVTEKATFTDLASSLGTQGAWEVKLLSRLHQSGDIYKTADARWQGAPTRLIFLGRNSHVALLLGGQPAIAVRLLGDVPVQEWGPLRFVRRRDLDPPLRSDESIWQSYRDWLTLPIASMEQWAPTFMEEEIGNFTVGEPPDATNVEIYSGLRGRFGWRPLSEARDISYPSLCRSDLRQGNNVSKLYWLANIEQVSRRIKASSTIGRNDATRLALAIEKESSGTISLSYRIEDERIVVRVTKSLPFPEAKVMALSLRVGRSEYCWPQPLLPFVSDVFGSLGISLIPVSPGHKEK